MSYERLINGTLRLFFRIQVIEVAVELVETVIGRQELIAVAEMVLAELPRGISQRFQRLGDGDISCLQSCGAPGSPTLDSPVRFAPGR